MPLLENLEIIYPRIYLQNQWVDIIIKRLSTDSFYELEIFYNTCRIKNTGRQALYCLLEHLLAIGHLNPTDTLQISHMMPSDHNLPKLVRIYESIGFQKTGEIMSATTGDILLSKNK